MAFHILQKTLRCTLTSGSPALAATALRPQHAGRTIATPSVAHILNKTISSYNRSQRDAVSQIYLDTELYMFRTDLLSILTSLADSQHN